MSDTSETTEPTMDERLQRMWEQLPDENVVDAVCDDILSSFEELECHSLTIEWHRWEVLTDDVLARVIEKFASNSMTLFIGVRCNDEGVPLLRCSMYPSTAGVVGAATPGISTVASAVHGGAF